MALDLDRLARLVEAAERAGLVEAEVARPGLRARIVRAVAPAPSSANARPAAGPAAASSSAPAVEDGTWTVRSPKVGVFRIGRDRHTRLPLRPGDEVRPGDPLGTVQIMKVPYEVVADRAGRLVEILVEDGAGVEYGQPLFRLEEA